MRELDDITGLIVNAAFELHSQIGPGLLESVYESVLAAKLEKLGLKVERQKRVPIIIDGMSFEEGFRTDLLVEGRVVVELKSVEQLAPVHAKQVLTYVKLMNLQVGLLINFGAPTLKEGLQRIVNKYRGAQPSNALSIQGRSNPPSAPPRLRVSQPHSPSRSSAPRCEAGPHSSGKTKPTRKVK